MRVKELQRLAAAHSKDSTLLFNPLMKDFSTKFADYDEVILRAGEVTPVNSGLAERIKKQLVTFITNERGIVPSEKELQNILNEIEVVL